jgi:hypothetical protein
MIRGLGRSEACDVNEATRRKILWPRFREEKEGNENALLLFQRPFLVLVKVPHESLALTIGPGFRWINDVILALSRRPGRA